MEINIAELLKDCPKGMELDCTIYDECTLRSILEGEQYPIKLQTPEGSLLLTKYGSLSLCTHSKCVIFPKGKTTWEGFVPPCKFKDGDIINKGDFIAIVSYIEPNGLVWYHCWYDMHHKTFKVKNDYGIGRINDGDKIRFATEEEKEKLFKAIKDNGYDWDSDTKTLNKFKIKKGKWYVCIKKWYDEYDNEIFHKGYTYYSPENGKLMPSNSNVPYEILFYGDEYFREWTISDAKDGDVLYSDVDDNEDDDGRYKNVFILKEIIEYRVIAHCFINVDGFIPTETFLVENTYPIRLATEEEKARLFQAIKDYGYKWNSKTKTLEKLIEPKFKVGDRIKSKGLNLGIVTITKVCEDHYELDDGCTLKLNGQDYYELVPNKFDINTLKPYESRVLVRDSNKEKWKPNFWGFYDIDSAMNYPYECCGISFAQCIPYEGNEHLFGTNNDCDKFYKTWE